jgi:hypothetical protein
MSAFMLERPKTHSSRANMPTCDASQPLVGAKTHNLGSGVPNYAKPTDAALRRGRSFRNRTARNNHPLLSPLALSRPTSQTQPTSNPHTKNSYPPDADARHIGRLWAKIMADKRRGGATGPTLASLARVKQLANVDSGIGSRSGTASATHSSRGSSATAKTNDQDFEDMVLKPRHIQIDHSTKSVLATFHFEVAEPPAQDLPQYYQGLPGLSESTLWLDANELFLADIVREYDSMIQHGLNEAEYATYAIESLLKREVRNPRLPETRHLLAERMIQLVAKPEDHWEPPPVLDSNVPLKPYNFDIRPDCSYWISLQAFNPSYRSSVTEYVSVRNERILCPYLTIEFKKDDSTLRKARRQVAVASALALYNRWKLTVARLVATEKPWTERRKKVLKHYGLTFTGRSYEFWCIEPTLSSEGSWIGCRMYRLIQSKLITPRDVHLFINWINEIHRWGLTVHGPSCESDIKHCIDSTPGGIRTSLGMGGDEQAIDSEDEAGLEADG